MYVDDKDSTSSVILTLLYSPLYHRPSSKGSGLAQSSESGEVSEQTERDGGVP